jgi:hypothetical protein
MNYKLGNIIILAVVIFITLQGLFSLQSPKIHLICSYQENGFTYQVEKIPPHYYTWFGGYYTGTNIIYITFLIVLFYLLDNSVAKIACLLGSVYCFCIALFGTIGLFYHIYFCRALVGFEFECFFGILSILVLSVYFYLK